MENFITKEMILEKAEEIGMPLIDEEVDIFVALQRLPSVVVEEQVYYFKGFTFKAKKKNFTNRKLFWNSFYKINAQLSSFIREYGAIAGFTIFLTEGENARNLVYSLVDGDYAVINFEPETDENFLELQEFVSKILVDFFYTSRNELKKLKK